MARFSWIINSIKHFKRSLTDFVILSAHCPMKPLRALPEEIGSYPTFKWCLVLKPYYYHLRKLRKEICEQIPVPVMTVPEETACVRISIGEVTAEIPEGISEQMMTTLIRAMRNSLQCSMRRKILPKKRSLKKLTR